MDLLIQLGLGLVLSGIIAGLAYWRGSLSGSGVAGAMIVGTMIFGFGGWAWGLVLIAFFVLSSVLSSYQEALKARVAAEKFDKGGRRDIAQALANAGAGALIALAYHLHPQPILLAAFVGAMATVNADTWATELGVLSRRPPRLITTFREVEPGTSGAISAQGTLATFVGGLVIGLAALALIALEGALGGPGIARYGLAAGPLALRVIVGAALGGLAGSLFDSLLGATVQAIYWSEPRGKETEKRIDPDGTPNRLLRGFRWLNNDLVNLISSGVGALAGALIWWLLA
ncbi:MAG: DUF92 domain-containing protein [Anaerolineae bacterium]